MNLLKKTILATGLLATTSMAADRAMIGIGIDMPLAGFGAIKNTGTNPLYSDGNIYINIHANSQFVMVAGLGYGSEATEDVASKTITTNSIYRLILNPSFIYATTEVVEGTAGIRFGYASKSNSVDVDGKTTDNSSSALSFGATTGVEYFFNKHFAIKSNIELNYDMSSQDKDEDMGLDETNYSGLNIVPKITLNWYFN